MTLYRETSRVKLKARQFKYTGFHGTVVQVARCMTASSGFLANMAHLEHAIFTNYVMGNIRVTAFL